LRKWKNVNVRFDQLKSKKSGEHIDFMESGDYKFTLSDAREGGENPPLPRNCDR